MFRRRYRLVILSAITITYLGYQGYYIASDHSVHSPKDWVAKIGQRPGHSNDVVESPQSASKGTGVEADSPPANGNGRPAKTSLDTGSKAPDKDSLFVPDGKPVIWKPTDGNLVDGKPVGWEPQDGHLVQKPADDPHWTKPAEVYPVPDNDLIRLPNGERASIPRIQFAFGEESPASEKIRIGRLAAVKTEIKRAWGGYGEKAWGHDELRPVSGGSREPFCGWAATLVDSLDTLYIAGMKKEFDEAVRTVDKIDFTYTGRQDLPVFETVIRYLGGLLAAFDVSGGHDGNHRNLLVKAIELADVLYGVFDTPNRMPVLNYRWRQAGNPKQAGTVNVAELGSMTMEFTRLAQLTGDNRWYDAVARVVDALEDLQNRAPEDDGSQVPGIFPEVLDASGCSPESGKAERRHNKGIARDEVAASNVVGAADKEKTCVARLRPSIGYDQSYSMGAAQDSAYEYFPKQYILLGGRESKFRTMHLKTTAAVKSRLLFRPMIPENSRDLRFSGKLTIRDDATNAPGTNAEETMQYEASHLACFLGGMFGLGGRAFGEKNDVVIATKLTDGCVWAYESMASGIMPEVATVVPCKSMKNCKWDEEKWHQWANAMTGKEDEQTQQKGSGIDSAQAEELREIMARNTRGAVPANMNKKSPPRLDGRPDVHMKRVDDKTKKDRIPPGFTGVSASYYILRPEAIESVWYMYRITGDATWMDKGWRMFESVVAATRTNYGHSALDDVTVEKPVQNDGMQSFWIGETLKYFYLLFSKPDVISLDEWVLNTEAHPFKRPV